ncbi:MAG TPA: S8 family serine peptidase, partial [Labilithrix sp.]|nr:S8 family serine peptidase [Labilithrix sp.]
MNRPILRSFPIAAAFVSFAVVAHAPMPASGASRPPNLASPRVHPEASILFAHRSRTGTTFPTFLRNLTFEQTGRLPVVVRWLTQPDARKREALRKSGVSFERSEPIASGAWLATVSEEGLRALEADPDLARVSVDMFHRAPLPLAQSLEETTANIAKRAAIAKDGKPLDGSGIVIADIDTPMYIHHPAFFRADGGTFAWTDVDGDGKLTPGSDGIDLDGSGTIEPNEVLHELRSTAVSAYKQEPLDEHSEFQPDIDYLFLDTNGNGRRDHGKGFGESTPAYGEPLFVFDDANHDLATQPSERVIQLKTSKIRAIVSEGRTFTRDKSGASGLSRYSADTNETLAPQMGHATGVAGILLGGQSNLSRWTGIAPGAELLLYETNSDRGPASGVQWAIDRKANVILTEYAPYTNVSLDGSSEDESILDAASDRGIVTVSPAGNLASSRKHRTMTLQAGPQKIVLGTTSSVRLASISLHYKGPPRQLALALKTPNGTVIDIPESSRTIELEDKTSLYVMNQTTPRGTHERFVNYVGDAPLPTGTYELTATLDPGAPLEVDMFASDDVYAWTGGFAFDTNTASRTICNPSTSDKTISVAAYVLHEEDGYAAAGKKGELARYSSRGPTLAGATGIDIAAPDNPLSASPPAEGFDGVLWEPFGGTSGAGPHVAAAVALLAVSPLLVVTLGLLAVGLLLVGLAPVALVAQHAVAEVVDGALPGQRLELVGRR